MQIDLIWLDSNLTDLGPIELTPVQQLESFLICYRIKLFNLIKSISQDWYLVIYYDYPKDIKFDWNIKYTLQW